MAVSKVLVCDDSATDLAHLTDIVSKAGCTVISADNGADALEKARQERPDMIFLDIIMPEMDGYETCRKLTADPDTKHIPVVFVTSKDQKADRVWAQMQGARDLVSKPYDAAQIEAQLARL